MERASVSAISLRHILASPGYAPGTITSVTWMKRGFNPCQMHRSMYPSIFNHFPVIQPISSKVRHFSTFFAHFGLLWVRPWDNRCKCYMDGKRIQCLSKAWQHVPIYLQLFPSNSTCLSSIVCHFSTYFGLPWDNRGKFYMDGKRIHWWSNT